MLTSVNISDHMDALGFWFLALTWEKEESKNVVGNFRTQVEAVTVLNKHTGYATVELNFVKFDDASSM